MKNTKVNAIIFIGGFVGVLSMIPVIPSLLALQGEDIPFSIVTMQFISILQSSLILVLMIWLGSTFSKKVGLSTPVISAIANSENIFQKLKPQIYPALAGGLLGGVFILIFSGAMSSYLPPEFLAAGEKFNPPWYTKILYGGITEEILVRWGLMSFFVWVVYRITQKKDSKIKSHNYVVAVILSALIFGLAHIPAASMLSPIVTTPLLFYIIIGNSGFGLIAGYLYWKYGLESAIASHMLAHVVMVVGASLIL